MNKNIFRQMDSRWASLPYPTKASNMGNSGCGCCACTHVIIEKDEYKNYTPKPIRKYMVGQGFVSPSQGTYWSGITKTLQHYGFTVINHPTMPDIFSTLNKRKKQKKPCLGVILFRAGSRGGVTWTSVGHYVAFVDYKVSNGKHYFFCKDSGGRQHDGWYAYETTMRGLIPQIWSALPKASKPKEEAKPAWVEKANAWAIKTSKQTPQYHYNRWKESDAKTHTCPICNKRKYDDHYGWNCIGWAFAIWHHGGGLKSNCNCHVIAAAKRILDAKTDEAAYNEAVKRIGLKDIKVIRNGGKSVKSMLKAGDICWTMSGGKIQHTYYYMGDGKYSDSTSGRSDNIKAGMTASSSLLNKTVLAVRYTGK